MSILHKLCIFILQLILLVTFVSPSTAMERRRDQFIKEHGHYIVPVPISYPGLGEAVALGGVYANAHDTYTDYAGFIIGGDIEGFGLAASDMHLIDRTLIAEVGTERLSKITVFNYNGRGMESDKDDYGLIELDDIRSEVARLRSSFYDRMLEAQVLVVDNQYHLAALRDKDGNLIQDTSDSETIDSRYFMLGLQLDWTDDFQDPRKGVRYNIARWWRNETQANTSEYYQLEHNLTAYLPVGRISTWAFNLFLSDAHVTRQGDTDFASVEQLLGVDCDAPDLTTTDRLRCIQSVENAIAHNRYGTASSMGGVSRLRSYPEGRYAGAHVMFYGTEFRWNLTEEFHPFDIGIAKDIRTGIQLSAFWETATVADEKDKLGDIWRDSYGFGIRFVMTSGLVFRAEIADGDEGSNIVMFLNYPWSDY